MKGAQSEESRAAAEPGSSINGESVFFGTDCETEWTSDRSMTFRFLDIATNMRIYPSPSIDISEESTPMNAGTELVENLQKRYGDGRTVEGKVSDAARGESVWARRMSEAERTLSAPENAARFAGGVTAITLGALMLAEGVISSVNGGTLFFEGVGRQFEFVVGALAVLLGASIMPRIR